MLVFPQLVTGASTLYPLKKRHIFRTVVNELGDGRKVVYEDTGAGTADWELHLTGMTRSEADAVDALFESVGGQWGTFIFLDPAGNMLTQSVDPSNTVWTNGPEIQFTQGVADPFGGTSAVRAGNAGQADQNISQILSVPGNFQYCISLWARTPGNSHAVLFGQTAGASATSALAIDGTWRFFELPLNLGQATDSVTFGVTLASGALVELYGMQVEPQLAASDYKPTGSESGVYPNARFASDTLTIKAQSTDVYDAIFKIIAAEK
jgi:hypothetical protein